MRFQVFSFASKKVQGSSSNRKVLMSLLSVLFHLQNIVSFLKFQFLAKIFGETFSIRYVPEINLISKAPLIKAFYLSSKTNFSKSETQLCRRKTAEDNNAKVNFSPNIRSSKLLHFFKFSFQEIYFSDKF